MVTDTRHKLPRQRFLVFSRVQFYVDVRKRIKNGQKYALSSEVKGMKWLLWIGEIGEGPGDPGLLSDFGLKMKKWQKGEKQGK